MERNVIIWSLESFRTEELLTLQAYLSTQLIRVEELLHKRLTEESRATLEALDNEIVLSDERQSSAG
ncbi:hypothetical protein FACS1894208_00290 [Clostridia bacterium]|nr:hypothetical protein FACS1894208_00290 [Clostridia bacterium]